MNTEKIARLKALREARDGTDMQQHEARMKRDSFARRQKQAMRNVFLSAVSCEFEQNGAAGVAARFIGVK
jgi:hypothetical protein